MSGTKIDSVFYQQLPLPPDFEFDVRIVRTQADALYRGFGKYDLHYHNCWEIDYVTHGEGVYIFENDVYNFENGDIYIIHPYEMHNAFPTGEIELFCFQFSEDNVVRSVFSDADYQEELNRSDTRFSTVVRRQNANYERLREILMRALQEWEEKRPGWKPAMRLSLAQLFLELVRDFTREGCRPSSMETRQNAGIRKAMDYINANFTKRITLEMVAKRAIMHKNYFCTVFKEQVGMTFYTYLNNLRLRYACTLLKSTERSVKEIAISSGFPAISSFNKAFKKAFQVTPVEYRAGWVHIDREPGQEAHVI